MAMIICGQEEPIPDTEVISTDKARAMEIEFIKHIKPR